MFLSFRRHRHLACTPSGAPAASTPAGSQPHSTARPHTPRTGALPQVHAPPPPPPPRRCRTALQPVAAAEPRKTDQRRRRQPSLSPSSCSCPLPWRNRHSALCASQCAPWQSFPHTVPHRPATAAMLERQRPLALPRKAAAPGVAAHVQRALPVRLLHQRRGRALAVLPAAAVALCAGRLRRLPRLGHAASGKASSRRACGPH